MIQARSEYTSKLIEIMLEAAPDQKFTFDSLSKQIGSPNVNIRGYIESARRFVRLHHQIEFLSIRGIGIKRSSPGELLTNAPLYLKGIKRKSGRALQSLECEKMESLSHGDRAALSVYQAMFITIRNEAELKQATKRVEIAKINAEEAARNVLSIKR